MHKAISLDKTCSTTRLVTQEKPEIVNSLDDKFETVLFLPIADGCKGEWRTR